MPRSVVVSRCAHRTAPAQERALYCNTLDSISARHQDVDEFKWRQMPATFKSVLLFSVVSALALVPRVSPAERRPDYSAVPGVVIDHSPAETQRYIGSPSIAILANGKSAASHDWFGLGPSNDRTRFSFFRTKGRNWP